MVQIPAKARQYYLPKRDGINSLTMRTFDVPKPTANQVLVKIHAVSLNFRDIAIAKNDYPGGVHDDIVPCCDGAGEVAAIGTDVCKWAVGDRVAAHAHLDYVGAGPRPEFLERGLGGTADGTLTEYQIFPDNALVKLPEYLSYEQASTLPSAGVTAWHCLRGPVPVKSGDYVLVLGTGGVSIFALQFAVSSGAIVIVTSSSNDKLAKAKELGATHVINYNETPDWDKEVLKITKGEGVDHVVEVGGAGTFSKSLNSIRMDGSVHMAGYLDGTPSQDDMPLAMKILAKHANVRGVLLGPRTMFDDLARALDAHKIEPLIDNVFVFDDALDAYKYLEGQKHVGKVVIRVTD